MRFNLGEVCLGRISALVVSRSRKSQFSTFPYDTGRKLVALEKLLDYSSHQPQQGGVRVVA